ncbi:MAG: metal ABC transporter ATP-binding protein [Muribaculaceae bacterium]|nr:metal ABC transporter ATP-binding protein [Muribaculaceae bacterium]
MDSDNVVIRLSDINMGWGGRKVLSDINLSVERGDFVAITGPNGGGKSTLLTIMLKLVRPQSGDVSYFAPDGSPVSRLHIGYLPQKNKIDSHFPITVREVISSGLLGPYGSGVADKGAAVEKTLETVGLTSHGDMAIGTLSGGQLQRTLLGRAIISKPDILVLDEPLSYLDKHFEQRVYELLAELAPTTTIILVSHEMTAIAKMAKRHLIVDGGIHECCARHHFYHACDEDGLL